MCVNRVTSVRSSQALDMNTTYPYTIDSGHGEFLTFKGLTQEPDGVRIDIEGGANPVQVRRCMYIISRDEGVRVISGWLEHQVRGRAADRGPGDVVVCRGTPRTSGGMPATTTCAASGWCKPPDNIGGFSRFLFASMKENGDGLALFDAAFLLTRYRTEFG